MTEEPRIVRDRLNGYYRRMADLNRRKKFIGMPIVDHEPRSGQIAKFTPIDVEEITEWIADFPLRWRRQ